MTRGKFVFTLLMTDGVKVTTSQIRASDPLRVKTFDRV